MKSASAGAASGCVVWLLTFGSVGFCLAMLSMPVGLFTSDSEFVVARVLGPMLCPDETTPHVVSHRIRTDEPGIHTVYELHCTNVTGVVVKKDGTYALLWVGLVGCVGLAIAALIALILAAPAGALFSKFLNRRQR